MAENESKENILNANDTFDINELASLNDDITPEFIEQLQNKISADPNSGVISNIDSDENLFEEIPRIKHNDDNIVNKLGKINDQIDDNFILKYKAKLKKQNEAKAAVSQEEKSKKNTQQASIEPEKSVDVVKKSNENEASSNQVEAESVSSTSVSNQTSSQPSLEQTPVVEASMQPTPQISPERIDKLSGGNITEKPITNEQIQYAESLDYLDENVNYSKYVIYIEPENKDFIESLTVKERKNLINRILKEQDDIAITKKRLTIMQTFLKHAIVAIITIAIAIPVLYTTINASLEASIDNYRRSQGLFQTLYKKHGKIKQY